MLNASCQLVLNRQIFLNMKTNDEFSVTQHHRVRVKRLTKRNETSDEKRENDETYARRLFNSSRNDSRSSTHLFSMKKTNTKIWNRKVNIRIQNDFSTKFREEMRRRLEFPWRKTKNIEMKWSIKFSLLLLVRLTNVRRSDTFWIRTNEIPSFWNFVLFDAPIANEQFDRFHRDIEESVN